MIFSTPDLEKHLEHAIEQDLSIVDETPLLLIGRQIAAWGGPASPNIDILCIGGEGNLVVMELKRAKTPGEVAAQTLICETTITLLDAQFIGHFSNPHLLEIFGVNGYAKSRRDIPSTIAAA